MDKCPIGYRAIIESLKLKTIPHFRESYITQIGRGKTLLQNQYEIHIYPKTYALKNPENLLENLEFALKYEGINLEIIKELFNKQDQNEIENYIKKQPTGVYSRKIWYLYEFLTGKKLELEDCHKIKYKYLLDPEQYFTVTGIKSPRHAIIDNMLGTLSFCPFVRRTEKLEKNISLHLDEEAKKLLKKYDAYLIARASNFLFTKETMSSYQIEKEQPDKNRLTRFVHILQIAATLDNLSKEKLIELQNIIVDPRFQDIDYRHNQNYIGENITPYFQRIHYISPKPEDVSLLMDGLLNSLNRMFASDIHAVVMAAIISFGFVFIHPFEDGNGRIHRFLIHYILSKKDFTPREMIFPVSAIMLQNMREYDATLEFFSKPLLSIVTDYSLSEDGIMKVNQETKDSYRFIDYTTFVEYLFACIQDAVYNYLEKEIEFLVNYDRTKKQIQNLVDMPDNQIDLFIKFVMQNNGKLSPQKQNKYFSKLEQQEITNITKIINETFKKR